MVESLARLTDPGDPSGPARPRRGERIGREQLARARSSAAPAAALRPVGAPRTPERYLRPIANPNGRGSAVGAFTTLVDVLDRVTDPRQGARPRSDAAPVPGGRGVPRCGTSARRRRPGTRWYVAVTSAVPRDARAIERVRTPTRRRSPRQAPAAVVEPEAVRVPARRRARTTPPDAPRRCRRSSPVGASGNSEKPEGSAPLGARSSRMAQWRKSLASGSSTTSAKRGDAIRGAGQVACGERRRRHT